MLPLVLAVHLAASALAPASATPRPTSLRGDMVVPTSASLLTPATALSAQTAPAAWWDYAERDPDFSIGLGLSYPEIALVWASAWPRRDLTIDGLFTLSTVDAGATWHAGLGGAHSLLLQGLVGWTHSIVATPVFGYRGLRLFAGGGYGAQGSFDFRAVVGFSAQQAGAGHWGYAPTAFLMLGKVF